MGLLPISTNIRSHSVSHSFKSGISHPAQAGQEDLRQEGYHGEFFFENY
jgi:hypothetical protein